MRRRSIIAAPTLALLLLLSSGCLWAPDLDRVRREIETQIPGAHFQKEFALSLGPIALGLARAITALAPPAAEASRYLRDVRRVKVAVYKVENLPASLDLRTPEHLVSLAEKDDWDVAVQVRAGRGDAVWVLYRSDKSDTLKELYVVALSGDELVLVRAAGNIERLVARAVQEHQHGGAFDVDDFF